MPYSIPNCLSDEVLQDIRIIDFGNLGLFWQCLYQAQLINMCFHCLPPELLVYTDDYFEDEI